MTDDDDERGEKTHYICQTYTRAGAALKVDKQFQYTTAAEAENRAEREATKSGCSGADAYSVIEDLGSGEVSEPEFLARFGDVPELED